MLMDTSMAIRCLRHSGRLRRHGQRSLLIQQMIHFTRCEPWKAMDFCGNFVTVVFQRNEWCLCDQSHAMFSRGAYRRNKTQ